jgi:hypothetical protein
MTRKSFKYFRFREPFCLAMAVFFLLTSLSLGQETKKTSKSKKDEESKKEEGLRVQGNLTTADPVDKVRPGRYSKVHPFKMVPGKTFIIELQDTGGGMDPYLRLEDSAGANLAQDDDSAGNQNARIMFTPSKEDMYRIIVTTCNPGVVGNYLLTVTPVPLGTMAPLPGQSIPLAIPIAMGDIVLTRLPSMGFPGENDYQATHGYFEHRYTLENLSEKNEHEVTLVMPRWRNNYHSGTYLDSLRKTVRVGPETTVQVSLFQPDLPLGSSGEVKVVIDGQTQEGVGQGHNQGNRGRRYSDSGWGYRTPAGLAASSLVILATPTVHIPLAEHVYKSSVGVPSTTIGSSRGVRNGFYEIKGPHYQQPFSYANLHRFFPPAEPIISWSKNWLGYSTFDGIALTGTEMDAAPAEVQKALWQFTECGGSLLIVGNCQLPESFGRWKEEVQGFQVYHLGFGHCLVTDKNIASWDPDEWRVVTGSWDYATTTWNQIRSPTEAHRIFPVVENIGIPVRVLFLFMLAFVILIGPVNFFWLGRARRRIWLLWTVPLFSLFTCVLLFGYMILSEGWNGHIRAEAVTMLDEVNQRAATVGWLGYYSPTTPGGGLHFDFNTELTPHVLRDHRYYNNNRRPCSVDWTEDQHLDSGWLIAKVPTHFLVRRNEKRLERIIVRQEGEKAPVLVNALKTDIQTIWVVGSNGQVYSASNVGAGAEATLAPTNDASQPKGKLNGFRAGFARDWLKLITDLENHPTDFLRPGCYLAVVEDAPFLEQGLRQVQTRKMKSVVFGIMKEPF